MPRYTQDPPITIKVEYTEGCNLACTFCGINSIREKAGGPFNFLTVRTAQRIAEEVARVGWTSRFEFAMHGEPSLNPDLVDILRIFRAALPRNQLMMTSNGGGFLRDVSQIDAAFDAGLNLLCLDDYQSVRIVPKLLERYRGSVPIVNYPESRGVSPYKRYPVDTRMIVIFEDISIPQPGVHNRLDNMGGCAAPKTAEKMGKRCARPFRELAIRWNGKVATCCDDWRGQYYIGDVTRTPIDELWQNEAFLALRKKLYYGERDFGACDGCSDVSTRAGLLPDRMGKQHLPRPNSHDQEVIQTALKKGKLTTIVLRPWEKT